MCIILLTVFGDDYNTDASLNITFEADISSNFATRCTSIGIIEDSLVECAHNFGVMSGAPHCDINITSLSSLTTVTIEDNDGE